MGPNGQLDPNDDKTRRLSRRSWLAIAGAAGLVAVGGYALAGGLRSPDPKWIAPLPTEGGYGSAAADDSTLYFYVRDERGPESVLALDGATGVRRWNVRLDSPSSGDVRVIPAGAALVVGTSDFVSVHDTATGRPRWQIPRSRWSDPSGDPSPTIAVGAAEGVVVMRSGHGFVALDVRTGDLLWEAQFRSPENSRKTSADVMIHNGMCIAVNAHLLRAESGLHSMTWIDSWDLRTGQPVWSTSTDVEESFGSAGMRIFPSGDRVVVTSVTEVSLVLEVATGRRLSETWATGFVVGDVIVNVRVNWNFAELTGVDLADGSTRWSEGFESSEPDPSFGYLGCDGLVYVWEPGGIMVALDADSGSTRWTYGGQHAAGARVIAAHGRDVYTVAGREIEAFTVT
jgi:outer membrane protein assembly factor BamB